MSQLECGKMAASPQKKTKINPWPRADTSYSWRGREMLSSTEAPFHQPPESFKRAYLSLHFQYSCCWGIQPTVIGIACNCAPTFCLSLPASETYLGPSRPTQLQCCKGFADSRGHLVFAKNDPQKNSRLLLEFGTTKRERPLEMFEKFDSKLGFNPILQ